MSVNRALLCRLTRPMLTLSDRRSRRALLRKMQGLMAWKIGIVSLASKSHPWAMRSRTSRLCIIDHMTKQTTTASSRETSRHDSTLARFTRRRRMLLQHRLRQTMRIWIDKKASLKLELIACLIMSCSKGTTTTRGWMAYAPRTCQCLTALCKDSTKRLYGLFMITRPSMTAHQNLPSLSSGRNSNMNRRTGLRLTNSRWKRISRP